MQAFVVLVPAMAASYAGTIDRFSDCLDGLRTQLGVPGMSAAIVHNGEVLWTRGYGYRDVTRRLPATPDTQYAIASITKCMSGTLLMQLIDEGKIRLDTPMQQYLPDRFRSDAVTVGHVFSHAVDGPGRRFNYRADLFRLLTRVLEQAGGEPLAVMFQRRLFNALGMERTVAGYEHPRAAAVLREAALSYRRTQGRWVQTRLSSEYRQFFASFGVVSSVTDLARFAAALDTGALISAEQQRVMLSPYRAGDMLLPYGLGWYVSRAFGEPVAWHYGLLFDTFSSLIIRLPQQKLTFIILANSDQLSTQFELHAGNLFRSPVAVCFLRHFVAERIIDDALPGLPFSNSANESIAFAREQRQREPRYLYGLELFSRGIVLRSQGNTAAGEQLMAHALELDASLPFWYDRFNIRYFAGVANDVLNRAARQIVDNLLERDPDDPRVLFEQGRMLWTGGRRDEAVQVFEKVLQYGQYAGYANIRTWSGYYLGTHFQSLNRTRSRRYLQQALDAGGGDRNLRNRIQRMLR